MLGAVGAMLGWNCLIDADVELSKIAVRRNNGRRCIIET